jgi:hypothetical protein
VNLKYLRCKKTKNLLQYIKVYFYLKISDMNQDKSQDTLNNMGDVIQYYNLLIFDEKYWKQKGIWKIAEVTYSYHKKT